MKLLEIDSLTKSYGTRMLFADVSFGINEGDKIGIVAKNGTGKSTLLRIISGEESPDSGRVVFANDVRVGYLEQTPVFDDSVTVLEACMQGRKDITEIISAYHKALDDGDERQIQHATDKMDAAKAWDFEDRLNTMLTSLGIHAGHKTLVSTLSGGQRKRVALAALLISEPQLIILDEPTNHLDIPVIEWLENYLSRMRVTLLMVTHDRYFLDRICNKIIEIDREQIYTYAGNYDYFLKKRNERIEALEAQLARDRNTLRREQEWMNRQPQARAGKARYRIEQFYDLKERTNINLQEKNIDLRGNASYIGNSIFEAVNVSKRYGDKVILDNFSYIFSRYEKVGIIGANGVGKSTFIKMLQGLEPLDSGEWKVGSTVRFGYYSQMGIEFKEEEKVIDAITRLTEDVVYDGAHLSPMQFLTKFLFSPADQQKYISTLSGGERCRLHLATVLMRQPNFLILDEPTNDLDIVTLGLLEQYLSEYKGCLIVISHDRYFLDNIVDHLFVFQGDGVIKDFPGTYSEYSAFRTENEPKQDQKTKSSDTTNVKVKTPKVPRLSFAEKREFEQLEKDIEALNNEKEHIESQFNSGECLTNIEDISKRYSEVKDLLDEKEMRWLELSEKMS